MPETVTITINGVKKDDLKDDLLEVAVDTNLYMPAMFSITVKDVLDSKTGKLAYTDAEVFKPGAEVKIEIETDEIPEEPGSVRATLIIGEITAIEPDFAAGGVPGLRVRGYDRSHRLTRGKNTRVYGDANPAGAGIAEDKIVQTIVRETDGLTGQQIDTSGLSNIKYCYVLQYNQTDLEFLWSRARLLGYQVYVIDKTLYFQKADAHRGPESDKPANLIWRRNLGRFEPRLTLMHQVTEARALGWDPDQKTSIEGKATSDTSKTIPKIGLNKKGSALSKEAFKDPAVDAVVDHPLVSIDQAKAMAAARFAEAESEFIRADGSCRQGDPRLIAGRVVTIEDVGQKFSGDYYVTEARHVWARGGYAVTFSVTGRHPYSLSYLLNERDGHERGLIHGVVTAKVVSLEDPEELGRVQVMFPWLPKYKDADLSSNWARLANPMGGAERGFFYIPEIDDEVLVVFEHGDVNLPYIVGTLWNKKDKPPEGTAKILSDDKKKINQRILRSRSGHLILLDDKEGEEHITITSMSGHTVILDDKGGSETITIRDKTEKNEMVIDSAKNSMTIKVEGDFNVEAKGKITLKSTQDMTLQSQANSKIKAGANLGLEGTAKSELKGAQVSVNGSAQTEVKGGAMVQVQGALVKIN
jgi:phage baseplate assembly protein gpV